MARVSKVYSVGSVPRNIRYLSEYDTLQEALTDAAGRTLVIDKNILVAADDTSFCPNNTEVIGLPGFIITSVATASNRYAVIQSGDDCRFENIRFQGSQVDAAGYCAISTTDKNNVTIKECNVLGHGEAFLVQNSDNIRVLDCKIDATHRWSIMFARASNCYAIRNRITGSITSDGIKLNGNVYDDATDYESSNIQLLFNNISGCERDGIDCATGGDTVILEGNICKNNILNGFEIKAHKTSVTLQRIIARGGNIAIGNGASGFRLDDVTKSQVSDLTCMANADGVLVENNITQCDFSNITSNDNSLTGMRIEGDAVIGSCADVTIDDCTFLSNGTGGTNGLSFGDYINGLRISRIRAYQTSSGKTNSGIGYIGAIPGTVTDVDIEDCYCPNDKLENTTKNPISLGGHTGDGIYMSNNQTATANLTVFTDGDTTPSVSGIGSTYQTNNSSPTTITGFNNMPFEGGPFRVIFNDGNTEIQASGGIGGIRLEGTDNLSPAPNQHTVLTFIVRNGRAVEQSRQLA